MNRSLRIGLIAEGEAELGSTVPYIRPQDGGKVIDRSQEGALHTLIRRELIAAGYPECDFAQRHPSLRETRKGKRRTGHGVLDRKYIAQTVVAWKPAEVDMVVILVDADDIVAQRRRDLAKALETVQKYHLDENNHNIPNCNAGGLAIKNFDTWLLADSVNVESLLGIELPKDLPDDLETLPADKNSARHAKRILDNAIDQSQYLVTVKEGLRLLKTRWQLAFVVDLKQVKQRCQQGYKTFMDEVCMAAEQIVIKLDDEA